jgi:hypothetical protein
MPAPAPADAVVPFRFVPNQINQGGRLGVAISAPSAVLVDQLDLPEGRGIVIESVAEDSAAAAAGLKANDIVLEFAGKEVTSDPAAFIELVRSAAADEELEAVVLRKGRKETVSGIKLPEAQEQDQLFQFQVVPNGQFQGIRVMPIPGIPGGAGIPAFPGGAVIPGLPAAPAAPALPGDGGSERSMIQFTNNNFTAEYGKDDLTIRLEGTAADGKNTVTSVHITDGDTELKTDNLEDVPEKYQPQIEKILSGIIVN